MVREANVAAVSLDSIGGQIAWHRLIGLVNEAGAMLRKTSFSPIVRESNDFACALLDHSGELVAQADVSLAMFTNSLQTALRTVLEEYPAESWRPGDGFIINDPWLASGDLHDMHIFSPVFVEGELVAFAGSVAHWPDVGGRRWSSDSEEVFEEGLRLPALPLLRGDRLEPTLLKIIRANTRMPAQVLGDLSAQLVANKGIAEGLKSLIADGIIGDFATLAADIKDRAELMMRQGIRRVPNGSYRYELCLDGYSEEVREVVTVHVDTDRVVVDFTGSSEQADRGINSVRGYTIGTSSVALKSVFDPVTPNNAGTLRPFEFVLPERSIVNAAFPIATGGRGNCGHYTAMAVLGALAKAEPERGMAESGNVWIVNFAGTEESGPWVGNFVLSSGVGASGTHDGWSCRMFPHNAAGTSIEIVERAVPLRVRHKRFADGSGGDGAYRGGLGQELEIEFTGRASATVSFIAEKVVHAAAGAEGGRAGRPGATQINGRDVNPKGLHVLHPGDVVSLRTPGGGGYGPPGSPADGSTGLVGAAR